MKNIHFLFVLLFSLLISCANKKNDQKDNENKKTSITNNVKTKKEFPIEKKLKNNQTFIEKAIFINRMGLTRDYLFTSCFRCSPMIYTFSIPNLELVDSFGIRGNGPDDYSFPVFHANSSNLLAIWGYSDLRKIEKFNVNKQGKLSFLNEYKLKDSKGYNESHLVKDSFFIYNNVPESFSIKKININTSEEVGEFNFEINKEIKEILNQDNKGNIAASDNGIAYLFYYKDQINFYDLNLNQVNSIIVNTNIERDLQNYKKSKVYYTQSYSGNNYLYALYKGTDLQDNSFAGNCIEVYSWKGDKIARYYLDMYIAYFVVDENNSRIYAYSAENPDYITWFDIK